VLVREEQGLLVLEPPQHRREGLVVTDAVPQGHGRTASP
jgi:hypothetical protein